jgi:hypothetical protein
MKRCQSFPIHFWVDLLHAESSSRCLEHSISGVTEASFVSHLFYLHLSDIPHSGYFSPDVVTAGPPGVDH